MVDISAIGSALASLKAAKDIAEAMIGIRDGAAFQAKLIEFQSKLIDANNSAFAAQEERTALTEEIRRLKR
jgi:outer membrane lipopolysaccharide assembly protein LptE/RlpB